MMKNHGDATSLSLDKARALAEFSDKIIELLESFGVDPTNLAEEKRDLTIVLSGALVGSGVNLLKYAGAPLEVVLDVVRSQWGEEDMS